MPERVRAVAHIARVEIISLVLCVLCCLQVQAQLAFPTTNGGFAEVTLGDPPRAPKDVSGLPGGGPRMQSVTGGFSVNTDSREQARGFYSAVFNSSTGVPMNTSANVATCTPGTNAAAFQEAVLRRINWYRAMAGVPASVTLNAAEGTNDQQAAVMMSRNSTLNHFPPNTWTCFTGPGANAASNSNLALGADGADSITLYIQDPGSVNTAVGHRRWLLYPQTQVMATGDVPAANGFEAANATWVYDANLNGPRPATRQGYVAWPPEGFVPYQVVFPEWSFGLSNADLSVATVSMTSNGVPVAVTIQPYVTSFGENTLVWYPSALDPTSFSTVFPFNGADTAYGITISNIGVGASHISVSYNVTVFDPAVPGADYIPTTITGPSQIPATTGTPYFCRASNNPNVTSYQWRTSQRLSGNLFDNANNGLANFTISPPPDYPTITNAPDGSGSCFHLAHPDISETVPQLLQLNRLFLPNSNTTVSFKSQLGYAATFEVARFQVSTDGGLSWNDLYALFGVNDQTEFSFSQHSFSLSSYAGQATLLRFNYDILPPRYFNPGAEPTNGWCIENIVITNAEQLVNFATNSTASTNYTFTPALAGNYSLEAQGLIFTQFPLGWGPAKLITAVPVVTTAADSGVGSLRQVAGVLQGGGTVTFATNLSGQTITLTSGEIAITNNLTIDASALPNGIIINGNHQSRIFNIGGGASVTLNALVLTNGYTTNGNWGGAILNAGTLALNYCTLAGNSGDSSIAGGAIANQGPMTALGCTFSGNSAGFAGAIDNRSTCTLENSTFYGNAAFAGNGGAVDSSSATLSVLQCTFWGNSAGNVGGAIDNYLGQANVTNSILAGDSGHDIYNWSGSTIDAGGANIIPGLGNAGTLVGGGTISSANPLLGTPANNGGRTLTMMPQPGSPAINAGVTSLAVGLAYDQRGPGYPRVVGSAVDIGAVEYDAPVITSPNSVTFLAGLSNSFTLTATGWPAPTIAVSGTFPLGVGFTPPATLSGTPPDGSGGAYPLTVTAFNGISPNAAEYPTVNVVERSVFAAHPNFNTNGLGWALNGDSVNGGPQMANNVFTLTDGTSGENRSAWFPYPLYVGAFEASFTYQDVGTYGADGVGFVIQNDPRGTTALGLPGGGLGYVGITPSVAVLLNIYSGSPGGLSGLMLGTNGVGAFDGSGAYSGNSYLNTPPVFLDGGNPIAVALRYTDGILQVSLTDTVTSANFQANFPLNIPAFAGTNVAWVGITGSEGGVVSHQTVSNFSYVPLPTLAISRQPGSLVFTWPASVYGFVLESNSSLNNPAGWASVAATVTQTNNLNQVVIPPPTGPQFYRLVLP